MLKNVGTHICSYPCHISSVHTSYIHEALEMLSGDGAGERAEEQRRTEMGPGLNEIEYEYAVARQQELASEYMAVQRRVINSGGDTSIDRAARPNIRTAWGTARCQVQSTLKSIAGVF